MKSYVFTAALALFLALAFSGLSWADCGSSSVCSDVENSLAGSIEIEDITISWSTDEENSSIDYYRLLRYDCAQPETCSTVVATVNAVGTCNTLEEYDYQDTPPSTASSWSYVVEVWVDGSRVCSYDVTPE